MKKILITGASGFVGQNLVQYCNTHAMDSVPLSLREGLPAAIPSGINVIVHLAGKAHDIKHVSDPAEYFSINTELTKKLFDQFLLSDASVFIFMSSVKASADTVKNILTEDSPPNPGTPYGKSKLEAEHYLLSRILPENKRLYILRPCMIHGPGNKGNLNSLFQLVKKGIPYPLMVFENKRSFLSVNNLCFVIHELIRKKDTISGIYNVSDDMPLSTNEVMEIIGQELSKKVKFIRVNKSIIKGIARIGDLIPFPLNSHKLKKLTENYVVSNKKLLNALQVVLPLNSKEGLHISIRSFSNNS